MQSTSAFIVFFTFARLNHFMLAFHKTQSSFLFCCCCSLPCFLESFGLLSLPSYCVISDLLLIFYYSPVPSSIIQDDIAAVISIFSLPFLALPGISLADSWGAFVLSLCHDRVQWDLLKPIPWLYLLPVTIRNLLPPKRTEQIKFRSGESMHKHRESHEPSVEVQLLRPHLDLNHRTPVKNSSQITTF